MERQLAQIAHDNGAHRCDLISTTLRWHFANMIFVDDRVSAWTDVMESRDRSQIDHRSLHDVDTARVTWTFAVRPCVDSIICDARRRSASGPDQGHHAGPLLVEYCMSGSDCSRDGSKRDPKERTPVDGMHIVHSPWKDVESVGGQGSRAKMCCDDHEKHCSATAKTMSFGVRTSSIQQRKLNLVHLIFI